MKTIVLILSSLVCAALGERTVVLSWDANPAAELVTGYVVTVDGKEQPAVASTTATIPVPDAKTVIAVIATTAVGWSAPSDPLTLPASPSSPKGLRVTAIMRTTISTPSP